jgi:hypothetical protein
MCLIFWSAMRNANTVVVTALQRHRYGQAIQEVLRDGQIGTM